MEAWAQTKGVSLASRCCLYCKSTECDLHIFFKCSFYIRMWDWIFQVAGVRRPASNSTTFIWQSLSLKDATEKGYGVVFFLLIFTLMKIRNAQIFGNQRLNLHSAKRSLQELLSQSRASIKQPFAMLALHSIINFLNVSCA